MKKIFLTLALIGIFAFVPFALANEETAETEDSIQNEEASDQPTKKDELKNRIEEQKQKAEERLKKQNEKQKELKAKLSQKKEERKVKSLEEAKERATKKIDSAIKKLSKIKERVENIKVISDDQKTEINTKIDSRITVLEAKKTDVSAATTKEEIKTALGGGVKELRNTKEIIKSIVEGIHRTQITNLIEKTEKFIVKIESKLSALPEAKQEKVKVAIELANGYIAEAKTSLNSGNIKEAKEALKNAHKAIGNALDDTEEEEAKNE